MSRSARPRRRGEDGFTLVELIVAVVLMGIVVVPLGVSFVEAAKTTGATSNSLGSSHDTQLVDYYLQRDSAGASATTSPTAWTCAAAAGVTVTGTAGLVQFTWTQADVAVTGSTLASGDQQFTTGASYEADYVFANGTLTRYYCSVSGAVGTIIQANKLATTLSTTSPPTATPVATCTAGGTGPCITITTVTWTDVSGKAFSTILYDRSFS